MSHLSFNLAQNLVQTDDNLLQEIEFCESFQKSLAMSEQGVLNLAPLQPPNFSWGERVQITLLASQQGKPVPKISVNIWFSGQHGWKTRIYSKTTNSDGRVTFLLTIDRSWARKTKWLDLNAASPAIVAKARWRIKG